MTFSSFQDKERYEHVSPKVTRSQEGKDNKIAKREEEFCLVSRLKFGVKNSTDYNKAKDPIPFRGRVFSSDLDGRPIRGKDVVLLIESDVFTKLDDNDVISLCCVGILQLVLLGVEDRRPVPNWLLRLANDRVSWDNYPWGSYVWPTLYKHLRDANVKRWQPLYANDPTNETDAKSHRLKVLLGGSRDNYLLRDWYRMRLRLDRDGGFQMKEKNDDMYEKMTRFMEDMRRVPEANTTPIIADQHFGGVPSSFYTLANNSSFFNMATPSNWQTPNQSNWLSPSNWQTPNPSYLGTPNSQPSIPSQPGTSNWQNPMTSRRQDARILDLNLCDRARREPQPSVYMLSPYTVLPPTTVEEFCLVSGLKFGVENSTDYNKVKDPIPFRRRVFSSDLDGRPIRGKDVVLLIESDVFTKLDDNDVISLCCVGILQLVLLGVDDRRPVPNWILRLANDRVSWDNYPWGSYVWPTLYKHLRDANVKRWQPLYTNDPTNETDAKSYRLKVLLGCSRDNYLLRDWHLMRLRLDRDGGFQMKEKNDDMYEKMTRFMKDMRRVPEANTTPIIADQHFGVSDISGFQSYQGVPSSFHTLANNSSFFNMATPSNWQTPNQSNWLSPSNWQTPNPSYLAHGFMDSWIQIVIRERTENANWTLAKSGVYANKRWGSSLGYWRNKLG
nr:phospholipase-like, aminotransferase-like mobile domain protein [Tanacetum cinerariifolium]